MNLIEIAGFLGADAEERFTGGGKRVVSMRVGCKVRSGKEDKTIWWRVNIWSDRFDKMIPYLKKGTAVIVIGEMSLPETYVDKEGKTQISLTLNAEIIKFSPFGKSGKSGEEGGGGGFRQPIQQGASADMGFAEEMAMAGSGHGESDDLPF